MLRLRLAAALAILVAAFSLAPIGTAAASPIAVSTAHVRVASTHLGAKSEAMIPECIPNPDTGDCRPLCSVRASDFDCDGFSPADQGCTSDQQPLLKGTAYDYHNNDAVAGWVTLYWSNKCQSNWAVTTAAHCSGCAGYFTDWVKVWRGGDGLSYGLNCGDTIYACTSPLVYAPTVCAGSQGYLVGGPYPYTAYAAYATQSGC